MGYYQNQVDRVLQGQKPPSGIYRIKITSETEETNWLNITEKELKAIRNILKRS